MKKKKKQVFSTVKAVKSNARDRVGQPKPERIIIDAPTAARRKAKHKESLSEILDSGE